MEKQTNRIFSKEAWRLTKPDFMQKAAEQRKGFPIVIEFIKFFILYILAFWIMPSVYIRLLSAAGMDLNAVFQSNFQTLLLNCIIVALSMILFIPAYLLIDRRSLSTMGFVRKDAFKELLKGAAFGFFSFSACLLLAVLTGAAHFERINQGTLWAILIFLPVYLIQGSAEEAMCRGYLMVNLSVRTHVWIAVLSNGLVFAAMHLMNPGASFFMILNIALVGVLFSVIVIKRGSIWCACGFHGLWNYAQGCFYGLPVSGAGSDAQSTLLQFSLAEDKPLLTGGIFGLEAGLIVTIVMGLILLAMILLVPGKD